MPQSVVVIYGPQGCGKTQAAEAFCEYYYCNEIVDDWTPGSNQEIPNNALLLTNRKPSVDELASLGEDAIAISFYGAIEELDE